MSEKQSDKHIIPIVVGEYDSATRDKGLTGRIGEAVVSAASRVVTTGKEYAKRIGVDARKSTLEGSAIGASNDDGLMKELGFSDNTEKSTDNSGASEGSADTSKSSAKPEAKEGKVNTPHV